jgi:hypothetical protein
LNLSTFLLESRTQARYLQGRLQHQVPSNGIANAEKWGFGPIFFDLICHK